MKIKTSELTGPALDWAVAKCDYDELAAALIQYPAQAKFYQKISPSTNWAQGGPIIEREMLCVNPDLPKGWMASTNNAESMQFGPTPLVAAMRCYVAHKMGDEIEVPDELL